MTRFRCCLIAATLVILPSLSARASAQDECWKNAVAMFKNYRAALARHDGSTVDFYNVKSIDKFMKDSGHIKSKAERAVRMKRYLARLDDRETDVAEPDGAYARCGKSSEGDPYTIAIFRSHVVYEPSTLVLIYVSILRGKMTDIALASKNDELDQSEAGMKLRDLPFVPIE